MADVTNYKIFKNDDFEILTKDGFQDFKGLIVGKNINKLLLTFSNGKSLLCTHHHKIMIDDLNFIYAHDMVVGDHIFGGHILISSENVENDEPVYEFLEIENNHTYYANDILSNQCLIIDEAAHIPNDLMKEIWKSVIPTISANKNGEIITISTPNGADKDNKFYQLYLEAQKENSIWALMLVNWWEIEGRDEEWKKQEIETIGSLHDFLQEYENCVSGESILDLISIDNEYTKKSIEQLYIDM